MIMKGSAGIKLLESGIDWRKKYLTGIPIQTIATNAKKNAQVVSRAIWLAKIPEDLKTIIKENPEIFTRRILINGFAAKRALCEKDSFKLLRTEVQRMAKEGLGSKPKFPKKESIKPKQKEEQKIVSLKEEASSNASATINILEAIDAEYQIKQALGFHTQVSFDKEGAGEVRIFFQNKKALHSLIEMLIPNVFVEGVRNV